jgi:hypothetical protein
LFENFLTEDGDLLRAKFKAFKFPESNFVLFRGVVNVCLDKCQGVRWAKMFFGSILLLLLFLFMFLMLELLLVLLLLLFL